jgi:hypothetical protein
MPVTLEATMSQATLPLNADQTVATLTVKGGSSTESVALRPAEGVGAPNIVWKLFH